MSDLLDVAKTATAEEIASELKTGLLESLNEGDRAFAESLMKGLEKYKHLSDKQDYWLRRMYNKALGGEIKVEVSQSVGDFSGVYKLFEIAKTNLKWPRIDLRTEELGTVQLALSGAKSKTPNTINVTDGKPFGQNVWYGRVDKEGNWTKGFKVNGQAESVLFKLLTALAEDPAGTAKKSAILNGKCCFCNTKLTDKRSTAAGYGETCSKKWGLHSQWKNAQGVFDKE